MWIRQLGLCLIGGVGGFTVAAGIFAFITILQLMPRLAARTDTSMHIPWYENAIILGAGLGNLWYLFRLPCPVGVVGSCVFSLFAGIFIGSLAMALAESLRVIPILSRRMKIVEGLPLLILAIALGKLAGALFQFLYLELH